MHIYIIISNYLIEVSSTIYQRHLIILLFRCLSHFRQVSSVYTMHAIQHIDVIPVITIFYVGSSSNEIGPNVIIPYLPLLGLLCQFALSSFRLYH